MVKSTGTRTAAVFALLLLFLSPALVRAQDDGSGKQQVRVETKDGNTFIGELVYRDNEQIIVRTASFGELTIQMSNVESLTFIRSGQMKEGQYWYENPQSTRYFFSPNAIGLGKGRRYYQNVWIFFNNVNVGVTDNISVGGGVVPLFLLGAPATPFWFLPKVSFPVADNFYLAGGAMVGGVLGAGGSAGGMLYGMSTVGDRDRNLSLGLGYGISDGKVSGSPVITLSAMLRMTRATYVMTENYIITAEDNAGLYIYGLRYAPEKFAVDFGLARPTGIGGDFIGIPWLGVSLPFTNKE